MSHDNIEDLRKFGEELQHSSKNVLSKYSQSHSKNLRYTKISNIFHNLYFLIRFLSKWFYRQVQKGMHGTTKHLGALRSFALDKYPSSFPTSVKERTEKHFFRLVETKRQIGNITLIIRKRIETPFNFKEPSRFSLYFFHKRSAGLSAVKPHNQRSDSLFDVPVPLRPQKPTIRKKMKFFSPRL